jgi:hypothetical protein
VAKLDNCRLLSLIWAEALSLTLARAGVSAALAQVEGTFPAPRPTSRRQMVTAGEVVNAFGVPGEVEASEAVKV